jgi:hypothetical protein
VQANGKHGLEVVVLNVALDQRIANEHDAVVGLEFKGRVVGSDRQQRCEKKRCDELIPSPPVSAKTPDFGLHHDGDYRGYQQQGVVANSCSTPEKHKIDRTKGRKCAPETLFKSLR